MELLTHYTSSFERILITDQLRNIYSSSVCSASETTRNRISVGYLLTHLNVRTVLRKLSEVTYDDEVSVEELCDETLIQ